MSKLFSTNPANNEVVGEVEVSTYDEIKQKVAAANNAKQGWKMLGMKKRIELLKPICDDFASRKDEISELITKETGKLKKESIIEANDYVTEFEWFMGNAEKALADETTHEDKNSVHKIVYEPFGTAAVITPWNFPFGMAIAGIIPNLIAGNTVVFKISEECPLLGKLVEDVMNAHSLPEGVFNEVYGAGDVGEKLARSDVDLIMFTGSSRVGKLLYGIAAGKFIKVILEMGGSSPCVVFEDIDIPKFVPLIYDERFAVCGQVCDSVKRLIVHESIFEKVVEQLKGLVEQKVVGDPTDDKTDMSCLVANRQIDLLKEQVKDAVDKGAKVITGGRVAGIGGNFFEPTILTNINRDMRVWNEEVFGPVLPVVKFRTESEAVELANDTAYGLGSRVFSADIERARRVARGIDAGTVEINKVSRWLPCNPFGGFKNSGMGREYGTVGFRELCQIKVISEEK